MGFFSKKDKGELALVFDVGSSAISGTIFRIRKDGAPRIIFSTTEQIPIQDKMNSSRFLTLTTEALEIVTEKVCLKGLGAPKKIFCVLSSPWFASQTRTVEVSKEEPFIFTPKMADELIQKEISAFEEEHSPKYQDENKVRVIELRNMKIKLNGYDTVSPFNQKVNSLELSIFFSITEEKVLVSFKEAIGKHFYHRDIRFASFMIASFAVARDVFINQESFILVNIGGEITDISMVKANVLCESISFPLGRNFIIRTVAEETSSTLADAKAHLALYKAGHIEDKLASKWEPSIEKAKNEWLKNFQEFLSKLTNDISIPSTVFITTDPELSEFFADIIKNEQFNQYILTESKFRVIFLGTQALHGIAEIPAGSPLLPSVVLDCIYINRFLN